MKSKLFLYCGIFFIYPCYLVAKSSEYAAFHYPPYVERDNGFLQNYVKKYIESNNISKDISVYPFKRAVRQSLKTGGAYFPGAGSCEKGFIASKEIFVTRYVLVTRNDKDFTLDFDTILENQGNIVGVVGDKYGKTVQEKLKGYRNFRSLPRLDRVVSLLADKRADYLILDEINYLMNAEIFDDNDLIVHLDKPVSNSSLYVCYVNSSFNEAVFGQDFSDYIDKNSIVDFLFDYIIENQDLNFEVIDNYFEVRS